jgi:hypothetical protein
MLINKLNQIITKYGHDCDEIGIMANKNELLGLDTKNIKLRLETDNFDSSCIIIMFNNNNYKFINGYINKGKTIIMINPVNYNFNELVKSINANSIDAISWRNDDGQKHDQYIIVINKY